MPNEVGFVGAPGLPGRAQPPVSANPNSRQNLGGFLTGLAVEGASNYVSNPNFRDKVNTGVRGAYDRVSGGKGPKPRSGRGNRGRGSNNNNNGGGGGSNSSDNFDFPSSSGTSVLHDAPNPQSVSLGSPVNPNCFVDDFMSAEEDVCACLHMNCVEISVPENTVDDLSDYLMKVAIPRLQLSAQEAVSFGLNVATDFSTTNLRTYIHVTTQAHQVLMYYRSIISYFMNPELKNSGMLYLKSQITSEMMDKLEDLARKLSSMPYPPNLLELIRYLNCTFYTGDTQGSPLLKICPHVGSDTMVDYTDITTTYNALDSTILNRTGSLLGKAIPSWIPRRIKDTPSVPLYDPNFLTIFANSPCITTPEQGGALDHAVYPSAVADDETVQYCSFTNNLSGLAYALFSINRSDTGGNSWKPGLLKPIGLYAAGTETRWSYYKFGDVTKFYPSMHYRFLNESRQDTHTLHNFTDAYSRHLFGTNNVMGVSVMTVRNTSKNVLDYLMSYKSIPSKRN